MTRQRVNRKARRLVADSEGFRSVAYRCPAGIWTIGFGFTKGVKPGDTITREQAEDRLDFELDHFADSIRNLITGPTNENQFGAMVSLAFNIGVAAFSRSTVLRLHNAGDYEGAARAFALWNKAKGRILPGLVRRRAEEAALYLEPVIPVQTIRREHMEVELRAYEPEPLPIPQQVDEERPLRSSRIMQSAGISGGVASLTLAAEGARAVGDIRYSLGEWLPYIALGVVILAAGWTIYERIQQRRKGIA